MCREGVEMLIDINYNRYAAVRYALKWAYSRNPCFYDFQDIGGDCTNFVSQSLNAGCGEMNFSQENGWYFISADDRAPAWTGVDFLRQFLLTNRGAGVYGETSELSGLAAGDIIQLANPSGRYYHSLFVSYVGLPAVPENIYVCAHSIDARNKRLSNYRYAEAQGIHILGARKDTDSERRLVCPEMTSGQVPQNPIGFFR